MGSPKSFANQLGSDRWTRRSCQWQRELEPFAGGQIVEPVALALLAKLPPVQLNFMVNPVQFLLAMMEPKVLVESLKYHPQMTFTPPVGKLGAQAANLYPETP
jgi:hypothetical protein